MNTAYVDTSVVTRWYVLEAGSREALKARRLIQLPMPFPPWLNLELNNAWSLKVFRGEITVAQVGLARDALEEDVERGLWKQDAIDIEKAFALSMNYAERHTPIVGSRSMDVLHVAAAQSGGYRLFFTSDKKQASLATRVGLDVRML